MRVQQHTIPFLAASFLAVAALFCLPSRASAADKYWDTDGGAANLQSGAGTWDTGTTSAWSTDSGGTALTTWGAGDSAFFQTAGVNTVTLSGTVDVASITHAGTGTNTTLNGGVLQFSTDAGVALSSTANLTINSDVELTQANTFFNVVVNRAVDVGGDVSGAGGFRKTNAGTLILRGDNTYTGGTLVESGRLQFTTASTIPTTGLVRMTGSGALAATGPTGFADFNEWLDSGRIDSTSTGVLALMGNTALAIDLSATHAGNLYNNLFVGAYNATTYTGALTPGSNGYLLGGGGFTLTMSSALNAATSLTIRNGSVVLTQNNGYNGLTTISSATTITNSGALGTTDAGTVVNSGGQLLLNGVNVVGEALTISGGGNNHGALSGNSGNSVWAGSVLLGADNTRIGLNGTTANLEISGVIDDGAGAFNLVIRNANGAAGVLTLSAQNTYGGRTDLFGGNLRLGVDDALPNTVLQFGITATRDCVFDLAGFSQTVAGVTELSTNVNASRIVSSLAGGVLTMDVNVNRSSKSTTLASPGVIFGGVEGNDFSVVKTGTAVYTMAGANTYTGETRVEAGTLALGADGGIAASESILVSSGAVFDVSAVTGGFTLGAAQTLGGNGTVVGQVAVLGTLSPGGSAGELSFTGNQSWQDGAGYQWEVGQVTVGGGAQTSLEGTNPGADLLSISGDLDLSSLSAGAFELDVTGLGSVANWNPNLDYDWVIASAANLVGFEASDFTITTTDFADNNSLTGSFSLSQVGSDLVLSYSAVAVPEPSTWALASLSLLGLLLRRRLRAA